MAKEYIEREAAKRELLSWAVCMNHPEYLMKDDALHVIDSIPAADVVEQEQESNEPLTLDELRQMKGKPVWAIDGTGTAAYILIDADGNGIDTDSGFWDADYYGMTKDGKPCLHRMGWLAYRHQLKNTTEG